MKQLNPNQKIFTKEDVIKEIKAGTDFGKHILEIEMEYYLELINDPIIEDWDNKEDSRWDKC